VRFSRALENHARSVGVRSARRDERQLAIQHSHEHRRIAVLRAIEAAVVLRVFGERGAARAVALATIASTAGTHSRIARRIAVIGIRQHGDAEL